MVVSNIGADSYVSAVTAKKAKGAIGVEGELGRRCSSIEGYAQNPQVVGVVDVWARQGVDAGSGGADVEVRVCRCCSLGLGYGFGDVRGDDLRRNQRRDWLKSSER